MNKSLLRQLQTARRKGVEDGLLAMSFAAYLAADNVLKDYLDEETMKRVLEELETEQTRIWNEVVEEAQGKQVLADEVAERLVGYVQRSLRERGLDDNPETTQDSSSSEK